MNDKVKLTLKEAVQLNNNHMFQRDNELKSMDKIKFEIKDGKFLGWEVDGRKLAVSAKPNEVVEPHFCNMIEVFDTITDVARYYDKVAERVSELEKANARLKDIESLKDDKTLDDFIEKANYTHYGRCPEYIFEPPVDPVLSVRQVARSSIGTNSMSGLVHYFVPVNEAAKEVQDKPCSEGLLTKEQLKALVGK